jgi:hypothetical protein
MSRTSTSGVPALVLALLIVGRAGSVAAHDAAIPQRFLGEWNENPAHCGTGLDHARFLVEAGEIIDYESSGRVRAVVTQGELELAVIAEMSGEGMEWMGLLHFRLSSDHGQLVELGGNDGPVVRYRCPGTGGRLDRGRGRDARRDAEDPG